MVGRRAGRVWPAPPLQLLLLLLLLAPAPPLLLPLLLALPQLSRQAAAFDCARVQLVSSNDTQSGEWRSPNYGTAPYPAGACFYYTVLAAPAEVIHLHLLQFNVGKQRKLGGRGSVCSHAFVDFLERGTYLRRLCGNCSGSVIRAVRNVTLLLYSREAPDLQPLRESPTPTGFRIRFEIRQLGGCGRTRYSSWQQPSGTVSSPQYAAPGYPPLTDCEFDLVGRSGERVVLHFVDIHLANSTLCHEDYVAVFNVVDSSQLLITEHLCGSPKMPRLISDTNWVKLKFHSSAIRWEEYRGFRLQFKFIRLEDLAREENSDPRCGADFYSGWSGVVTSPTVGEGGDDRRPALAANNAEPLRCAWILQVPPGWQLLLSLAEFQLPPSAAGGCRSAHVAVYDGYPTADRQPRQKFCPRSHHMLYERQLLSERRVLFIRFFAEARALAPDTKFRLTFTAALRDFSGSADCPGFLCSGSLRCRDSAGLSCSRLPRYCLHPSARCDGRRSCSMAEDTDEAGCVPWQLICWLSAGGALLVATVAMATTAACLLHRRRSRRRRSRTPLPRCSSNGSSSCRKKSWKSSMTDVELSSSLGGGGSQSLKPILKLGFGNDRYARVANNHYACTVLSANQVRYAPPPGAGQSALGQTTPTPSSASATVGRQQQEQQQQQQEQQQQEQQQQPNHSADCVSYTRHNSYSRIAEEEDDSDRRDSDDSDCGACQY